MPVSRKRSGGPISTALRKMMKSRRGTRWASRVQYGKRPGRKNKFYKRVKAAMLKASEVKAKYQAYTFGDGASATRVFAHDTIHSCILGGTVANNNVPTALAAGTGDNQRIGSDVYSIGFRVRGTFGLPYDRRNTTIKIWLVEWNSNQGSPTDVAQFFRNVTGSNLIDPVNTERFPGVKLLRTLRAKARDLYIERGELTDSGSIHQLPYDMWIPYKRKLRYASTANGNPTAGCKENFGLVMTCYDTFSAATTDNVIVDHDQMVTWYYKDL